MPDPPHHRREPPPIEVVAARAPVPYAELHCKTNFSFIEGASHPDELVARAAELGYRALAVTDRNSLAGIVRAHTAAKEARLKLIVGAEIFPVDAPPLVLFPTDRAAYGRLCRLLTLGRRRAPKGECEIRVDDIAAHSDGMIGIASLGIQNSESSSRKRGTRKQRSTVTSQKARGSQPPGRMTNDETPPAEQATHSSFVIGHSTLSPSLNSQLSTLNSYADLFGNRGYLFAERHFGPDDDRWLRHLRDVSAATGLPLVTANDVHYHIPGRRYLQDVLTATRHKCTVAELGTRAFPNAERHLKSPAEMAALFADDPELIARTIEIADRCQFSLNELRYEYPEELVPEGWTPLEYLKKLTWEGAAWRYPRGLPDKVRRQIEHELALIEEVHYEAYFLTVWDLVRYARSRDILCQGRGSAANSAVCYCLGVTSVDPDQIDLLFERFISKERNEAPDIDIDFEHERREEVIQYIYDKYGRERAGMTATLITYRVRSAVRDVGKALGLSLDRVDVLAKSFHWAFDEGRTSVHFREAGLDPQSQIARMLRALVMELLGFPRHLSQHVGGMVMTRSPLCELVPIENASMEGRTVIEWDKDDLDDLGILKVDCLCLGMLTAIRRAEDA